MLCSSCGKEIPEGTGVCPECGALQEDVNKAEESRLPDEEEYSENTEAFDNTENSDKTEDTPVPEVVMVPDSKEGKSKKGLIAGIAVIVVIIGLVLVLKSGFSGSRFSTCEDLTEQTVKYIEAKDVDGLVSISSDLTAYGIEGIGYSGSIEDFYQELIDGISENLGGALDSGSALSYEIIDSQTVPGEEFAENLDDLREQYPDYDWDQLNELGMVAAELKDESENTSNLAIMTIKEGDYWKLFVLMYY